MKEELRAQHAEHTALTARMETVIFINDSLLKINVFAQISFLSADEGVQDLQRIRLMLEESKYDVVKYCIGGSRVP